LPSKILNYKSPLQIFYKRKIIIDHLKIFGCTYYVHNNKRDKLDCTSIKAIFLGYYTHKKWYKCYDLINHKFYISRDVTFQENEPYFKESENKVNELDLSNIFIYPQINCSGDCETEMVNEDECETGEVTQTQ
jgi:hypothetical protein